MKKSQSIVNYRQGRGLQKCENCTMYREREGSQPHCTAVEDPISPDGVCDIFKRAIFRKEKGEPV
jgi:hypothetical protein